MAPVLAVARVCIASSSKLPSAASSARVTIERSRRLSSGRAQTEPQAPSVMKAWKSASRAVFAASARSTWASPSTRRRTAIPASKRSDKAVSPSGIGDERARAPRGCSTQGMWPAPRMSSKRAPGMLSAVSRTRSGGRRAVLVADGRQHRQAEAGGRRRAGRCRRGRRSSRSSRRPACGSACAARRASSSAFSARKARVNQRFRMPSAMASMPPARTLAMRSRQRRLGADLGGGVERTMARTRSGRSAARPWATAPPIERPTKTRAADPEAVQQAGGVGDEVAHPVVARRRVAEAVAAHVVADDAEARRADGGGAGSQIRKSVPSELAKTSGRPSRGPVSR